MDVTVPPGIMTTKDTTKIVFVISFIIIMMKYVILLIFFFVACRDDCITCTQAKKCTSCKTGFNRDLNHFTGNCDCNPGYEQENEDDQECKKCFMLADECVFKCPEHTFQNE